MPGLLSLAHRPDACCLECGCCADDGCADAILDSNGEPILDSNGECILDSQWEFAYLFDGPDGPLPDEWIDASSLFSEGFEPLALYDQGLVSDPYDNRSGPYGPGGMSYGVGMAFQEFGFVDCEVEVVWSGLFEDPNHVEGGPAAAVEPDTAGFASALWQFEVLGAPIVAMGEIGNPVEDFVVDETASFTPAEGVLRRFSVRYESGGTTMTFWLDGEQLSVTGLGGVPVYGLDPVPVDADLQGSTRKGFVHDAHLVDPPSNIPTTPSIVRWRMRRL